MQKKIVIFASGAGTNAANIINYFHNTSINVELIVTNNPLARVIEVAASYDIPYKVFSHKNEEMISYVDNIKPDLIVLAGYLKLIPSEMISKYHHRIINIHPALLPKYGGKGMYGAKVHESVLNSDDKISGITIHYVNSKYDEGEIIMQKSVEISKDETPQSLASKVHQLEYEYYPRIIENLLSNQ